MGMGTQELKDILDAMDGKVSNATLNITVNGSIPTLPGQSEGSKGKDKEPVYEQYANGGDVAGGVPIIVGEKGPELFVPNSAGNIIDAILLVMLMLSVQDVSPRHVPIINKYFMIAPNCKGIQGIQPKI